MYKTLFIGLPRVNGTNTQIKKGCQYLKNINKIFCMWKEVETYEKNNTAEEATVGQVVADHFCRTCKRTGSELAISMAGMWIMAKQGVLWGSSYWMTFSTLPQFHRADNLVCAIGGLRRWRRGSSVKKWTNSWENLCFHHASRYL